MTTNFKQISKTANKDKILEFNDFMQLNDFNEEKGGKLSSTLHSKFSKIGIIIVDTTFGKKEKAKVLKFNFEPSTIKAIAQKIVDCNKDLFIPGYTLEKIDPYNKDQNGYSPVSKITIRYQEKMNNPWTFYIENGIGIPIKNATTGGINIKKGSYKKICFSQVVVENWTAITKMGEVKDYIYEWENSHMSTFIKLRNAAEKKYIENTKNNTSSTNNAQNSMTNYNSNSITEVSSTSDNPPAYACSHCKSEINQRIYDYSIKKHGAPLCLDCQKTSPNNSTRLTTINSQKPDNTLICTDCKNTISDKVYKYSIDKYGISLCLKCQGKHKNQIKSA